MIKQYPCDLCEKIFNKKTDLIQHKNASCTLNEIKEVKTDIKTSLINVFKSCLNILRDNEGLTGEKAFRNMSYLLILKLLEPQFDTEINIDDYNYDFSHLQDHYIEYHRSTLLKIARFSNLSIENEDNVPIKFKYLWDDYIGRTF